MTAESGPGTSDAPAATLAERLLARDPRAIARAITLVENESSTGAALIGQIYDRTGRAYLVGVTGAPGAGKSTLVDRLIGEFRRAGSTVGVVAVDPTSPFTGGAILGDRVRMHGHFEDAGVFIRSMATRGHLGGLARTTAEVATILDAAGFDIVIIETVGVGQDEVDVVRTADVSIVVVVPGTGDDVQALKAGIMEIADIFVVNKADRDGADRTAAAIETTLSLEDWGAGEWRPPVLRTEATTGRGIPELMETMARFRVATAAEAGARRRERAEWRLREILGRRFMQHVEHDVLAPGEFDALLDRIASRTLDPYHAADQVLGRVLRGSEVFSTESGRLVPEEAENDIGSRFTKNVKRLPMSFSPDPLDHVGIGVADADGLVSMFRDLFGLATGEAEVVGQHRLRFVQAGGVTLELVEPTGADAPVGKFLEKRGTALHHLCFRVPDIDEAVARLKRLGVRLIDDVPRAGAHGSRIAFLHPSSAHGLLIELKEPARE